MSDADEISVQVAADVVQARLEFLGRMRGTVWITRPRPTTTDPDTGETHSSEQLVFEGPSYTRYPGIAQENNPETGAAVFVISRVIVRIPHGPVIRPGDVVEITADPDNPHLVGTRLRVESLDNQSQATAQRLLCSDNQGVA